jgi:serine/threonine-protein kinase
LSQAVILLLVALIAWLMPRGLSIRRAPAVESTTSVGEKRAAPSLPSSTAMPETFGRYRVERPLGKAGCGARYLCLDTEDEDHRGDSEVVVRTFELGLNQRELANIKQRFLAEVEQAKQLDHETILPVRDAGEAQLRLFVVNDHVDGWDLRRIAQPNRLLKVPQVLEIAAKCAEALAYAHGRNVLHGEVCPLNVQYLAREKRIKLSGFGTSALTASVHAQSSRLLPTSYYLSPEYLTGDTVDEQADLFALGVTLYQLLSGQLPFRADSVATLTYRIVSEAPPPIQALRPEVPDCAVAILERCLAKSPLDRYPNGVALARDLRVCAHHVLRQEAHG